MTFRTPTARPTPATKQWSDSVTHAAACAQQQPPSCSLAKPQLVCSTTLSTSVSAAAAAAAVHEQYAEKSATAFAEHEQLQPGPQGHAPHAHSADAHEHSAPNTAATATSAANRSTASSSSAVDIFVA